MLINVVFFYSSCKQFSKRNIVTVYLFKGCQINSECTNHDRTGWERFDVDPRSRLAIREKRMPTIILVFHQLVTSEHDIPETEYIGVTLCANEMKP